jgi:acetyltransferase-like isoleucine patch superfamily enzyme
MDRLIAKQPSQSRATRPTDDAIVAPFLMQPAAHAPARWDEELIRSRLGAPLAWAYRALGGGRRWKVARLIFWVLLRLEGRGFRSATARQLLKRYHDIEVGAYSYGECMIPGVFPPGVTVGRYTSIAAGVRVYNQNHPLDHLSTHPYFYDERLGCVASNPMPRHRLVIGSDVWIGYNAVITPGCRRIGDGAVIGAGAVVTRDVEDFAIVGGCPARLIRYRFPAELRQRVRASGWWTRPLADCVAAMEHMTRPVPERIELHPLLKPDACPASAMASALQ